MILSDPLARAPDATGMCSLRRQLQQLSSYDQDTGLPNYEALLGDINAEIAKVAPQPLGATFIEIRIKGLSRIGEAYGRKTIGSVIRQLAERLNAHPSKTGSLGALITRASGFFCTMSAIRCWPFKPPSNGCPVLKACPLGRPHADGRGHRRRGPHHEAVQDAATLLHHAGLALRASSESGSPGSPFLIRRKPGCKRRNDLVAIVAKAVEQNSLKWSTSRSLPSIRQAGGLRSPDAAEASRVSATSRQPNSSPLPRKPASSRGLAPGASKMSAAPRLSGRRILWPASIFRRPSSIREPCWRRSTPPSSAPSFLLTGSISKLPKAPSQGSGIGTLATQFPARHGLFHRP